MSHGLPEGWQWGKLGEVTEILLSGVDKKSEEGEIPTRLCNYMDVYTNLYITDDLNFMEATATRSEIERFTLFEDDVLLTKDSETREDIARSAVIIESLNEVVCGYHLAILRPNSANLHGVFLSAALQVEAIHSQFVAKANGSTRFGLTFDAIHNVLIPLPPLDEQRRIAAVLRDADASIARVEESIAAAEQVRQGFAERFISELEKVKSVKLSNILARVKREVEVDPEQLYYQIGIRSHGKGIFHKEAVTGRELGNKRIYWIEPGDFVLNIVFAWEGAVALVSENDRGMCGSHRFPTFAVQSHNCLPEYLLFYFKTPLGIRQLEDVSPGGAGRNKTLNQGDFLNLKIPLPELEAQGTMIESLQTHDDTIRALQAERERLRAVKRGLMQGLLSGQVRV